jgi:molybdenum cofactor biosynthesis protein B
MDFPEPSPLLPAEGTASPSASEHRAKARREYPAVGVAVVTVSDTRDASTDLSGPILKEELAAAGHRIVHYEVIPDDPGRIRFAFNTLCQKPEVQAIVFNGGTGVSRRDGTVEVVQPELEKILPGFGEIFRLLSWQEVGPPAILSRAVAGTRRGKAVFCLPGSANAVTLAARKILRPELAHLVWEISR